MLRLERVFSIEDDVLPLLPPPVAAGGAAVDGKPGRREDEQLSWQQQQLNNSGGVGGVGGGAGTAAVGLQGMHQKRDSRNVKVVGQEKGGVILFAWDGYGHDPNMPTPEKVTFVEILDLSTKKHQLLYTHHSVMNIVHASINQDRTLLVFTLCQRYQAPIDSTTVEGEIQDIYETCMAEVQPQGRVFSLGNPSRKMQRVQFLPIHDESNARVKQQKSLCYLLFIVHKEYIHAYSLPIAYVRATNGKSGWRIVEQPRKEYQVAKRFLWYQWDMTSQTLYYVYVKPTPRELVSRLEYMMKAVQFTEDGKGEPVMDMPIPIKLQTPASDESEYLHLACSRAVPDVSFHMEVVRTDAHTQVACFQTIDETAGRLNRSIQVTVVLLQRMSKLEFVIQLNNFSPNVIAKTRVAFTTLNHMLLIYLPGHYLQLIDCSAEHEPCPSLFFTGSELVTPFPDHAENEVDALGFGYTTHLDLFPNDPAVLGFALYDCRFDRAYKYTFSEDAILAFFSRSVPQIAHVQTLHLAIVHTPDVAIAIKAIKQICANQSQFATPEVLKEFLIGMTYVEMRSKFPGDGSQVPVLRLLPVTSIPPYGSPGEDSNFPAQRTASMGGLNNDDSSRSLGGSARSIRFSAESALAIFQPPSFAPSLASPIASVPSSGNLLSPASAPAPKISRSVFSNFFGRILNPLMTDPVPQKKGSQSMPGSSQSDTNTPTEEEEEDIVFRQRLVDVLTEFLAANLPKETKAKCNVWAKDYAQCQSNQVNALWNIMSDVLKTLPELRSGETKATAEHQAIFQLLESFYCAVEELHFPFPHGFHTKFAVFGLHCLPRYVFVQYIDRGVLRPTDSFMDHVQKLYGASVSQDDLRFKVHLVSRMRIKKAHRELKKLSEHERLMAKVAIQQRLLDAEGSDDDDNDVDTSAVMNLDGLVLTEADASAVASMDFHFIPQNVFGQHLCAKGLSQAEVMKVLSAQSSGLHF